MQWGYSSFAAYPSLYKYHNYQAGRTHGDCVSFQRTELISQRKLIQGIFLKTCHIKLPSDMPSRESVPDAGASFHDVRCRKNPWRAAARCQCKTYKAETRYNHSQYAVHVRYTFYTFIFVHLSFPFLKLIFLEPEIKEWVKSHLPDRPLQTSSRAERTTGSANAITAAPAFHR